MTVAPERPDRIYPAQIEVDLDALAANAQRMKELAGGAQVMAVVKANGYGFGRRQVARRLWEEGIRWFGVSRLPEALALREQFDAEGISPEDARILTWLNTPDHDWQGAVAANLDVSVSSLQQLQQVTQAVEALRTGGADPGPARVHLKVDVGMGRGGATLDDLPALADAVRSAVAAGDVALTGFWSHLSYADDPQGDGDEVTRAQLARFREGERIIRDRGLEPELRHLAASSGTIWYPEAHMDLVRPGVALYGYSPAPGVASSADLGLTPIGSFRTPVMQVKQVRPGDTVSYGATWTATGKRWIGLLPIGYADGVPRALSGNAVFLLEASGEPVSLLGRVCMDQMVIDLGDGEEPLAQVGDSVVLFGDPADGAPSADQWAAATDSINYEVISRLPEHIARTYRGETEGTAQ